MPIIISSDHMLQTRLHLLPLAKQFVWLLRDDVRKGQSSSTMPDAFFERWWLLKGRSEYPAWACLLDSDNTWLADRLSVISIEGTEVRLPRAFELLLGFRPDVVRRFTNEGRLDVLGAAGWFFTLGLKEHFLHSIVGIETIRELDKPLPGQDPDLQVPSATLLMRLVWQLLDHSLHEAMSLKSPQSRERFIAWFFGFAVNKFKLSPLIASRWRHWLLQDIRLNSDDTTTLPRFVVFSCMFSPELQKRFLPMANKGNHPLLDWSQRSLQQGGDWQWLTLNQPRSTASAGEVPVAIQTISPKLYGVNLFGFAFGELGIGEDLRMAVEACESAGIPYRVVNIDAGKNLRQGDDHLKQHVERGLGNSPYAINIFCLPGFDTVSRIFLGMGPEIFNGHYNIGWWPWELSVWPKQWVSAFNLMDELWSGSQFARDMYVRSSAKPVSLMPLPVSILRHQGFPRKHFMLPGHRFLFLFIFDFNSHLARKNPDALVAAFREAFPANDLSVGLVLKVMNGRDGDAHWDEFKKLIESDKRIFMISETIDRHEVLGLIGVCDAYVSLHRAEGFGRTLAEAMLMGKPVIATNYSGNTDFMPPDLTFPVSYTEIPIHPGEYPFVEADDQAVWADVSIADAARQMRSARTRAGKKGYADTVKRYAKAQFSVERIGCLMKDRLEQIRRQYLAG